MAPFEQVRPDRKSPRGATFGSGGETLAPGRRSRAPMGKARAGRAFFSSSALSPLYQTGRTSRPIILFGFGVELVWNQRTLPGCGGAGLDKREASARDRGGADRDLPAGFRWGRNGHQELPGLSDIAILTGVWRGMLEPRGSNFRRVHSAAALVTQRRKDADAFGGIGGGFRRSEFRGLVCQLLPLSE